MFDKVFLPFLFNDLKKEFNRNESQNGELQIIDPIDTCFKSLFNQCREVILKN
jgi:hypothetical protein